MIQINDNLQNYSPKALDNKHGKFVSGVWQPWATTTEANSAINIAYRHKGLTVIILEGGYPTEYWYRDGIADINLIKKDVLYTEYSSSWYPSGDGSIQSPLSGTVPVSNTPNNSLTLLPDGFYTPISIVEGVVYGGIVTWLSDYSYHVSAAGYYINGRFYTSPSTTVTLSDPDATFNRIDTFAVDINGQVLVLEGTPSSNPAQAPLDPATQLELSIALVETGTTEPTLDVECLYLNNTEWTSLSSTVRIDPASTVSPCEGSVSIEGTSVINGDNVKLTRSSAFDPATDHTIISFFIKSKGAWGGNNPNQRKLTLQFRSGNIPVGNIVNITNGSFGFDASITGTCQVISIALTQFNLPIGSTIDNLLITASLNNGSIGFFIDKICLQGSVLPEPPTSSITADNGLYMSSPNNVRWGVNPLVEDVSISTTAAYDIEFTGSNPAQTLTVTNTVGSGIIATGGTGSYGVYATGATGIQGNSSNGFAVVGNATGSGTGILGESISSQAGFFRMNPTSTNTVTTIATFQRLTSGTALDNIGGQLNISIEADDGIGYDAVSLIGKLTTVANATRTSSFEIANLNSGTLARKAALAGSGQWTWDTYGLGTHTGTDAYWLAVDSSGNVIEMPAPSSGGTYTVDNGLTENVANNFRLGGILLQNTTIDATASHTLLITGSVPSSTNSVFRVNNTLTGSTASQAIIGTISASNTNVNSVAISGSANSAVGIGGGTNTGTAVFGQATSGRGVHGNSTTGVGGHFQSNTGTPLYAHDFSSATNTITTILRLSRVSSGTPGNGIGGKIDFQAKASDAANYSTNELISKWTDATTATRTSQFIITGVNSGTTGDILTLNGNKSIRFNGYGINTFSGTAAYLLGVDASGNVVETAGGGGLSSVQVGNTVFVSKDGNDGTGLRERLDLPFLTIQAAITAASAGDTVVVHPGTYVEPITLKDGVDLYLHQNVIIDYGVSDTTPTVTDNGVAVTCTIDGYGIIRRNTSTNGSSHVMYFSNASSNITIRAKLINHTGNNAAGIRSNATIRVESDITVTGGASIGIWMDVSTVGGNVTYKGNLSAGDYGVLVSNDGIFYGEGKLFSEFNSALHIAGSSAYGEFTGTLESDGLFGLENSGGSGRLRNVQIITNTTTDVDGSGISKYGGSDLYLDDVTIKCAATNAKSIETQGNTSVGTIYIVTTCHANKPVQASPTVVITGRENLLISGTYDAHTPLDSADSLVNQSFLGTGSGGTGALFLADDQTWKTATVPDLQAVKTAGSAITGDLIITSDGLTGSDFEISDFGKITIVSGSYPSGSYTGLIGEFGNQWRLESIDSAGTGSQFITFSSSTEGISEIYAWDTSYTSNIVVKGTNVRIQESNDFTDRVLIGTNIYKDLTESSATDIFEVNLPNGTTSGGEILLSVHADDGTDFQIRTIRILWAATTKSGTTTINLTTAEEVVTTTTGTLTATITAVQGTQSFVVKVNATSSLTQTSLQASYQIRQMFGQGEITIL